MRLERLWWCLPATVLCATDGLLTLWGQPETYWSGNFASMREGHPVAAWFLGLHPLAFAAAGVPYLLVVVAVILWLPRRWAALTAAGVAAGHAFAVVVWCQILLRQPAFALVPMALVVVGLGLLAWQRGGARSAEPGATADRPRD
jgi:hypothetical protein